MPLTEEMRAAGWIEHDGPFTPKMLVRVLMRNGEELVSTVDRFNWLHFGIDQDIIAYKPEQPHDT